MRYELFRLGQLIFALALMFGAFLGGVAVGWWRWGREPARKESASFSAPAPSSAMRPRIKPDLFTPAEQHHEPVGLAQPAGLPSAGGRPEQLGSSVDPFG